MPTGPREDLDLALDGVGLAALVEGHHDDGRPVAPRGPGLGQEGGLALLERDRVHDRLALDAAQAGLDDLPARGVDHERDPADVRLGGQQVEEAGHGGRRVEQALVHVHVEHLGTVVDLLAGDLDGAVVVPGGDETGEAPRTGDVRPLAHVDEAAARRRDLQRLEPRQAERGRHGGGDPRRQAGDSRGDRRDMSRRRPAAAADDVDEPFLGPRAQGRRGGLGRLVVAAEVVGQPGVRVGGHGDRRDTPERLDVRAQLPSAQRAVEPDRDRSGVGDRDPEGLDRLSRQGAPRRVDDGPADDERQPDTGRLEGLLGGDDGSLGVERVEHGLDEEQVDAAFDQALGRLPVGDAQVLEADGPGASVVHVR